MEYYSQKGQDEWVIEEVFQRKRGGYFLDLAASDGIYLSNTYVLEQRYGWSGLCIEPNPYFFRQLARQRNCPCVDYCIDDGRGEVEFVLFSEFGGIIAADTDNNPALRTQSLAQARAQGGVIRLQTVPLVDVLDEAEAPETIDYFSFDVEGAETRILRHFPFHKYRFLSMTIERPTPELNALLFGNGYVFVRNHNYDSFYVHETLESVHELGKEQFVQIPPKEW